MMLTIRREQMLALEAYQRDRFCAELCQALQIRFPNLQRVCSNDELAQAVNECLLNAQSMGFDARSEIAYYTLLCLQFGVGFIDDPLLPWATEASRHTPVERIHYLERGAKAYARSVLGIDHRFLNLALERWMAAYFITPPPDVEGLAMLYPEKADHAGRLAVLAFVDATEILMQTPDIADRSLRNEFTRCAFIFGHRIHQDPFVPQIGRLMNSPPRESTLESIARLQAFALDLSWARRTSSPTRLS